MCVYIYIHTYTSDKHADLYRCMYVSLCIAGEVYVSSTLSTNRICSSNITVAISSAGIQILAAQNHSPLKKIKGSFSNG